jgi:ATP-binding cassette, subfamily C (CFTR/MRP), member 1
VSNKLLTEYGYTVSGVATNYATDGIGPARGMWNQAVQKRVSITSSMLSQIKGLKIMGLTDYIADLIQSLRSSELELSKKFRAFIIRIILIGTNVTPTYQEI